MHRFVWPYRVPSFFVCSPIPLEYSTILRIKVASESIVRTAIASLLITVNDDAVTTTVILCIVY
jgi:hypothetical protein